MQINPYLALEDCEAAMKFYAKTFGGEVVNTMRNKDMPGGGMPNVDPETIMHTEVKIGDRSIMGTQQSPAIGEGRTPQITIQTAWDDFDTAKSIFEALAADGEVKMPFDKTFWSAGFGYVVDKFGVPWMVNCNEDS